MFRIQVVRKGFPGAVYCGRGSALGNPFVMGGESQRDQVCDQYAIWFQERVAAKDPAVMAQLREIWKLGRHQGHVELACFCAPKRCHCDTIKAWLEGFF